MAETTIQAICQSVHHNKGSSDIDILIQKYINPAQQKQISYGIFMNMC